MKREWIQNKIKQGDSMKEYLKMSDIFGDIAVKVRDSNGRHVMCDGCGKRFGHHVGFDCRP